MKKLYFVRHGLSVANTEDKFADFHNPLTKEGEAQALLAAAQVVALDPKVDLIIASPQYRAKHTAEIIAGFIGYPLTDIEYSDFLVERSFGVLVGTLAGDFYGKHGVEAVDDVEGAETLATLHIRAAQALDHVNSKGNSTILLVSHGAFGRALRRVVNNEPPTDEYTKPVMIGNCEVIELI